MPQFPHCLASIGLAILLTGCEVVDQIRLSTAEYAGRIIVATCALSSTQRSANLAAVNGWLATSSMTPRALALDCDGDGSPDF